MPDGTWKPHEITWFSRLGISQIKNGSPLTTVSHSGCSEYSWLGSQSKQQQPEKAKLIELCLASYLIPQKAVWESMLGMEVFLGKQVDGSLCQFTLGGREELFLHVIEAPHLQFRTVLQRTARNVLLKMYLSKNVPCVGGRLLKQ